VHVRDPPPCKSDKGTVEESIMPEFATVYRAEDIAVREGPIVRGPEGPWSDDEIIDTVLRLVADHHRAVGAAIGKRSFSPSLAELRLSPLGQDLRLLAAGLDAETAEQIRDTAGRVTDLLLRPLAAEGLVIPPWFWGTAIGRIVARAIRATYGTSGLITLTEAADLLEVLPETVLGWTRDGGIPAIPDDAGRLQIPRETVERRRLVGRELSMRRTDDGEDVLLREQRIAS
jgi:hypothetical protein